jgi:lipoprotein Spr
MIAQLAIPARFMRVRYNGARYPGAAGARGLGGGANCQRFAYELLRHFGREIPDFRSSELWTDRRFTKRVVRMRPLDLLLFNRTPRACGAHLAVYLGGGRAIHLCKALGRPAIWSLEEFAACERYRIFLGARRAGKRRQSNPAASRSRTPRVAHGVRVSHRARVGRSAKSRAVRYAPTLPGLLRVSPGPFTR